MDIVPSGDRLMIEARVNPNDIDVVHPGLTAKVRFNAFSQRNSLPVDGKVIKVSADRLTDDRSKGRAGRPDLWPNLREKLLVPLQRLNCARLVAWSLIFIPTFIFYAVLKRTPLVALFALMALLIGVGWSSGDGA